MSDLSKAEAACLNCSLFVCDDEDDLCGFTQITRSAGLDRQRARTLRKGQKAEIEDFKIKMLEILGDLIGQKAVDAAKAKVENHK